MNDTHTFRASKVKALLTTSWKHRFATRPPNIPVKAAPFGRWALRDKAAQRRSHLR
ncbi:MAG: hypothetical protein WCY67_04335 [Acidithiobacillus sp.]